MFKLYLQKKVISPINWVLKVFSLVSASRIHWKCYQSWYTAWYRVIELNQIKFAKIMHWIKKLEGKFILWGMRFKNTDDFYSNGNPPISTWGFSYVYVEYSPKLHALSHVEIECGNGIWETFLPLKKVSVSSFCLFSCMIFLLFSYVSGLFEVYREKTPRKKRFWLRIPRRSSDIPLT